MIVVLLVVIAMAVILTSNLFRKATGWGAFFGISSVWAIEALAVAPAVTSEFPDNGLLIVLLMCLAGACATNALRLHNQRNIEPDS